MTVLARLLASEKDTMGYMTYVFECLDEEIIKQSKYVLCTRLPNWEHRTVELGETGYLQFIEVRAGIDKWFDGQTMVPYRYDNVYFIKFVRKPDQQDYKYIID